MSGIVPPWLQSPRGLFVAGALLVALLLAVPGYVAWTGKGEAPPPAAAQPIADPASEGAMDLIPE